MNTWHMMMYHACNNEIFAAVIYKTLKFTNWVLNTWFRGSSIKYIKYIWRCEQLSNSVYWFLHLQYTTLT